MENIIYLIIGIGIGYFVLKLIIRPFSSHADRGAITEETKKEHLIEKQMMEKEENLRKVLEMFDVRKKVVNNDIEKELGVSDATATNYLEELERTGKIRQIGVTGQSVYYELKK